MQSMEHPRAPPARGIVRMDVFWSMWRSRTIPCPHGTGRPACETVLLHHEQFKIPENLARFAVRAGMKGFVSKMGPAVKQFVAERRQRVSPVRACQPHVLSTQGSLVPGFTRDQCMQSGKYPDNSIDWHVGLHNSTHLCEVDVAGAESNKLLIHYMLLQFSDDAQAYGMSHPVNPPVASAASVASLSDTASEASSTDRESLPDSPSEMQGLSKQHSRRQRRPVGPIRRLQQINAAVVAAGVAFALGRATNRRA